MLPWVEGSGLSLRGLDMDGVSAAFAAAAAEDDGKFEDVNDWESESCPTMLSESLLLKDMDDLYPLPSVGSLPIISIEEKRSDAHESCRLRSAPAVALLLLLPLPEGLERSRWEMRFEMSS